MKIFTIITLLLSIFPFFYFFLRNTTPPYQEIRDSILAILSQPGYDFGSIAPILVRLGWHSSGTYNATDNTGGSNGATMRFDPERSDPANAGLDIARAFLDPIKAQYPSISYGDLWTLAAYVSIEAMGGPVIEFKSGRKDAINGQACPANGRLPDASKNRTHIREIFYRMGFNDQEIVALIGGGHAIGKCHKERSGYEGRWTDTPINFTNNFFNELLYVNWKPKNWTGPLQYEDERGINMMLPTDLELRDDPIFIKYSQNYANNQTLFVEDFAKAYKKLTEFGLDE